MFPNKENEPQDGAIPEPSIIPSTTDPLCCSALNSGGKQDRTLNFLQSPANTPRHKLSTAMSVNYTHTPTEREKNLNKDQLKCGIEASI